MELRCAVKLEVYMGLGLIHYDRVVCQMQFRNNLKCCVTELAEPKNITTLFKISKWNSNSKKGMTMKCQWQSENLFMHLDGQASNQSQISCIYETQITNVPPRAE